LTAADLPVICVETRHMKALLTAQQINKTDRNDARGIAQMMRVGLFKPVHVKTLVAQEQRMLLTSRKLLQRKLLDVPERARQQALRVVTGHERRFPPSADAKGCGPITDPEPRKGCLASFSRGWAPDGMEVIVES
jgi:transposase